MTTLQRTVRNVGPKRQLKWGDPQLNADIASGSVLLHQLNSGLDQSEQQNCTAVRTIICMRLIAIADGANANAQYVHAGIGVVGLEAFNAGPGSVPSPAVANEEPIQGWIWKCSYWIVENYAYPGIVLIDEDIRVGRKIGAGVPFLRVDNNPGNGAIFNVRAVGTVRQLYMLA